MDLLLRTEQFCATGPQRLWSLSRTHALLVERYLGLEAGSVGVLPRYELYPLNKKYRSLRKDESIQLVYSGRIVAGKNLFRIVEFALLLKSVFAIEVEIHLAYPQVDGSFKDLCDLAEKNRVHLIDHGNLGVDWVQKINLSNPILVNFSTYACEDFNVSIAQAQSAGMPILLSGWGAFFDVSGPGVARLTLDQLNNLNGCRAVIIDAIETLSQSSDVSLTNYFRPARILSGKSLQDKAVRARSEYFELGNLRRTRLERFIVLSLRNPDGEIL